MKKILFLIGILFLSIGCVSAEGIRSFTCIYEPKNTEGVVNKITLNFVSYINDNYESISWKGIEKSASNGKTPIIVDQRLDPTGFGEKMFQSVFILDGGGCPNSIRVCMAQPTEDGEEGSYTDIVLAIDSEYHNFLSVGEEFEGYYLGKNDKDCKNFNLTNKDAGMTNNSLNSCDGFEEEKDLLQNYYDEGELANYKKLKDKVSSFCESTLNSADYEVGTTGNANGCIVKCLDLKFPDEEYGNNLSDCGFSDRLVIWIANIVRWIKYIIPVAVMALGIIDFIKAMASEKDDEMKKAQGRFVKRLIAAALIFLAPIIIEFVLDKMGFDSNGCGIIDL